MFAIDKSDDERREDRERKQARFGGMWRPPSYIDAYFDATKILYAHALKRDRLDELALPLVYMQRHTVELVIKNLLSALYDLSDGRQILADNKRGPPCDWKPSEGARERLVTKHDLHLLLDDLQRALAGLKFGSVPTLLIEISNELAKVEAGAESRLRYSTFGLPGEPRSTSFPEHVVLPVGRIQDLLVETIALYDTVEDDPSSPLSFLDDIYYEDRRQVEIMYELGLL